MIPAVIAVTLGVIAIGIFTDRHAVHVSAVKIVPPLVAPGGTAYAMFQITDYSHGFCNGGTVHRWLIDARGIVYPLTDVPVVQVHIPPESKGALAHSIPVKVRFPVPLAISEGAATYHARAERWCTPLQQLWPIRDDFTSAFEVSKDRGAMAPEPEGED